MDKQEFETLFDKIVRIPLSNEGFKSHGKSIYYLDDIINVSLLRLGGRLQTPGGISHVLCFRHSFLPNLDESIPKGFEGEVFAYPLKLVPGKIRNLFGLKIRYLSQNTNYEYGRLIFDGVSNNKVESQLEEVKKDLVAVVEWAKALDLQKFSGEIEDRGSSAWVEKLWLDAYAKILTEVT